MFNILISGASYHMFIYFYNVHNVSLLRIAPCETRLQNSERPSTPDPSRQLDGLPSCRANYEACPRLTMSHDFFSSFLSSTLFSSRIIGPKCVREPPATLRGSIHPRKRVHDVRGHSLLPVSTCSLVGLEKASLKDLKGTSGTGDAPN